MANEKTDSIKDETKDKWWIIFSKTREGPFIRGFFLITSSSGREEGHKASRQGEESFCDSHYLCCLQSRTSIRSESKRMIIQYCCWGIMRSYSSLLTAAQRRKESSSHYFHLERLESFSLRRSPCLGSQPHAWAGNLLPARHKAPTRFQSGLVSGLSGWTRFILCRRRRWQSSDVSHDWRRKVFQSKASRNFAELDLQSCHSLVMQAMSGVAN